MPPALAVGNVKMEVTSMSAIQELAPYIAKYQPSIKRAKMEKGYTCNDLVELSGISKSAVERLCDGTQADPKLFNAVALCKVLGLSIDKLFGLPSSVDSSAELRKKSMRWNCKTTSWK